MSVRDLTNNVAVENALDLQEITTDTTVTGTTIDLQGSNSLMFTVKTGTVTDGDYEVQLFASNDSGMSGESEITDADDGLLGTIVDWVADDDDDKIQQFGYGGDLRYTRIKIVSTNTTSGAFVSADAHKGRPDRAPATQADGT